MDSVIVCNLVAQLVVIVKDEGEYIAQGKFVLLIQLITGSYSSSYFIYVHMVSHTYTVAEFCRREGRESPTLLIDLELQAATQQLSGRRDFGLCFRFFVPIFYRVPVFIEIKLPGVGGLVVIVCRTIGEIRSHFQNLLSAVASAMNL